MPLVGLALLAHLDLARLPEVVEHVLDPHRRLQLERRGRVADVPQERGVLPALLEVGREPHAPEPQPRQREAHVEVDPVVLGFVVGHLQQFEVELGGVAHGHTDAEQVVAEPAPCRQATLRRAERPVRLPPLVVPAGGLAHQVVIERALVVLLGLALVDGAELFIARARRARRSHERGQHPREREQLTPEGASGVAALHARAARVSCEVACDAARSTNARARASISPKRPASASAGSASAPPIPQARQPAS